MTEAAEKVALFPIPNVVAFPGTVLPLHVFEPRYRQMVDDSEQSGRLIGVCHTAKEIRGARRQQSVQEALHSNQATYEPVPIFSAGRCQVVERTSDGRIYINILMEKRLRLVNEVQTLPYRIVTCEEVADVAENDPRTVDLQRRITGMLLHLIGRQNPSMLPRFNADQWLELPPGRFSFQVFQLLRFDAASMQDILENTSPHQRLEQIDGILKEVGRHGA